MLYWSLVKRADRKKNHTHNTHTHTLDLNHHHPTQIDNYDIHTTTHTIQSVQPTVADRLAQFNV